MPAKFEVRNLNRVGIISTYFPKKFGITLSWPRPLFEKSLRDHVQIVPGNLLAKFEVRGFERIGSRQRSSLTLKNRWTQVRGPKIDRRQSLI